MNDFYQLEYQESITVFLIMFCSMIDQLITPEAAAPMDNYEWFLINFCSMIDQLWKGKVLLSMINGQSMINDQLMINRWSMINWWSIDDQWSTKMINDQLMINRWSMIKKDDQWSIVDQ